MKAIMAVNKKGFIGLNGKLPWSCKEDLKHFKKLTSTSEINEVPILLVGHNTALTLPPLKGREVKVYRRNEIIGMKNIDWCIGGKATYEKFCHLFTELHISYINDYTIGDTLLPDLKTLPTTCKIFRYGFEADESWGGTEEASIFEESQNEVLKEDKVLTNLDEAKRLLEIERLTNNSKELSVTLTNLETSILWRKEDVKIKGMR